MIQDTFWAYAANDLAELFSYIPVFKLSDLGDDPQKYLADYVPTTSSWGERAEGLRQTFVRMERPQFQAVFATYREGLDERAG